MPALGGHPVFLLPDPRLRGDDKIGKPPMLDFSWSEFLVVIVVAVLAVGPKQLPEVLHGLGRLVRRLQYMKYAMSRQFDDFMEQSDLKELRDHSKFTPPELFDEEAADEEYNMKPLAPPAPVNDTQKKTDDQSGS